MEDVHEVAVYLHNFLNLDLFSQGFYALKVRCRLDDPTPVLGVPARVVQYAQVEEVDPSRVPQSVWQLEEGDKSFRSRVFWIKYARQDVLLQEMVAFTLLLRPPRGPATCGIIVEFDLLYGSPNKEIPQGLGMQQPPPVLDTVASQSFRIARSACNGLHAYCAVQFDTLHLALVDVSIHCTLLDVKDVKASVPTKARSGPLLPLEDLATASSLARTRLSSATSPRLSSQTPPESEISSPDRTSRSSGVDPVSKSWRRRKPRTSQSSEPVETDHAAALERWTEAKDRLDAELDESRLFLQDCGVSMTSPSKRGSRNTDSATSPKKNAWEWSSRVMKKQLKGLWSDFLEMHREHSGLITEHLRSKWRETRASEWALWTVAADIPLSPAGSPLDLRAEMVPRGRKARKRLAPAVVLSARRAEMHRQSMGEVNSPLLQDLSLFQHPSRHPLLSSERHVSGHRLASLPRHLPIIADHESPSSSSQVSLASSPADASPPSSPPPQSGPHLNPHLRRLSSKLGFEGTDAGLSSAVNRFLAETAPIESFELLVQEMAHVAWTGVHVVVFVHGFQGHHLDLRLVRDHWLVLDPSIEPLMSKANQELTFEPIQDMGARLAMEVAEFLETALGQRAHGRAPLARLSFVGHSLGNLIIRSALTQPLMKPYLERLHTCLSLSGPHLGYLYSGNALFNSGLWFMKRFKNSACMHQLTFSDHEDVRNCYLYELSQMRTLDLFKNVILVASPQDRYVPYHSARIELCPPATKDPKRGPAYASMIMGCMGSLAKATNEHEGLERSQTLLRCDVNFDTSATGRTLNNMLGRTAHIELLENDVYIRCLLWTHRDCFL